MINDDRVLRLLAEVLDEPPTTAPDHLLATVLRGVQTAPQRGGWALLPRLREALAAPSVRRLAAGAVLVAVIVAVAFLQFVPRPAVTGLGATTTPSAVPSATSASEAPSSSPSPQTSPGSPAVLEDSGPTTIRGGVTYTSNLFQPPVTFTLPDAGGSFTPWCSAHTSQHTIVLGGQPACLHDLRIIQPYAVDCGTADPHPDARSLAQAMLDRLGSKATRDRGDLATDIALPASLFAEPYSGRVIEITNGGPRFDRTATDPDHCRLLPQPGSADPTIELRSDMPALLMLLDVYGELVIVRIGAIGFDHSTGADSADRGYSREIDSTVDLVTKAITGIRFQATAPPPPSSSGPPASPVEIGRGEGLELPSNAFLISRQFEPHVTFRLT